MRTATRVLGVASALAISASLATAQVNSNDQPDNNNGDVVFLYSSPSSGFTVGANPPDITGDLYWKIQPASVMDSVSSLGGGSTMEIDGYYDSLFDTDWFTPPDFYSRTHGPAAASTLAPGTIEPAFFTLGLTTETLVVIGNSGFGNPCTVAPSLCSPSGGTCPPPGFVNGYLVDIAFGSSVGSGVVLPADGATDSATTWYVTGGMTASGGACGLGDYGLQDVHSTDESQADLAGGLNPDGGFQLAGSGAIAEAVTSMAEGNITFREAIVQIAADSGGGLGVEVGDNGGGATNGRRLSTTSGAASITRELRDLAGSTAGPHVAAIASAFGKLPNPGAPAFGANLLLLPDGLFSSTLEAGTVTATAFVFTSEGAFTGSSLAIPVVAATVSIFTQGLVLDLATLSGRSTNATETVLVP